MGGDSKSAAAVGLVLLPRHARQLEESAISPEVATARGYRSVDAERDAADLRGRGFADYQIRSGLLMPSYGPDGTIRPGQLKADVPRIGTDGKPIKYETPAGSQTYIDVPRTVHEKLNDPRITLHITEGFKKADAGASIGLCVVALTGVFNFSGWALKDLAEIPLKRRQVHLEFDSDAATNDDVQLAECRLASLLEALGADVRVKRLPPGSGGQKQALDDLIYAGYRVADLEALPDAPPPGDAGGGEERREQAHLLRERCRELQRENERLREIEQLTRRALANCEVRNEVATALAVIELLDDRQQLRPTPDGWVRVNVARLVEKTGTGRTTVWRHLKRLAALGVLEVEGRLSREEKVDEQGRRYRPHQVWARSDTKTATLKRLAYAQPAEDGVGTLDGGRRGHGGRRFSCPTCGEVTPEYRPHCPKCNAVLELESMFQDETLKNIDKPFHDETWSAPDEHCARCHEPTLDEGLCQRHLADVIAVRNAAAARAPPP